MTESPQSRLLRTSDFVACPRCGHNVHKHNVWETRGVVTCRECPRPKRAGEGTRLWDRRCRISIKKIDALADAHV